MTADRGAISSPKYPRTCPRNAFCLYEITLSAGSKLKLEFEKFAAFDKDYLKIQNSSHASEAIFENVTSVGDVEIQEYGNKLHLELSCDVLHSSQWHGFKLFYYDNQGMQIFFRLFS